ncbi:MAG: hypothetical protein M3R17_02505 [Bacteroidota bacterium]|nr:hypothetical protein [Bacteroidota bacterium]
MGILLPNNKQWAHAGWVSRSFFDDSLKVINENSSFFEIRDDILDTVKNYGFTLVYQVIEKEKLDKLKILVDKVIILNSDRGPTHFRDSKWFSVYAEKLEGLKNILAEIQIVDGI